MATLMRIDSYITKRDIIAHLKGLGVKAGMALEVHSSLSAFGYVVGGARSVVDALFECVGEEGTICMPLQERNNTEPSCWCNPAADHQLLAGIRMAMPPFDPLKSDCEYMGRIVENFRIREGVEYTWHPNAAFVAYGRYAKLLCNRQSLHFPLSEESPLARLYELDGQVLLLGVGYDKCTAMHLAEYRSNTRDVILQGGSIEKDGAVVWQKYLDLDLNSSEFALIGDILEESHQVQRMVVGEADCRLFSLRRAVDIGENYFRIA